MMHMGTLSRLQIYKYCFEPKGAITYMAFQANVGK